MSFLIACLTALLGFAALAAGAEYYVSPAANAAGTGAAGSPWSLAQANAAVQPGDTVVLLDGVYRGTPVAPERSGAEGRPITYRAAHPGRAVLTESQAMPGPFPDDDSGSPAAIFLLNRSHVVIDGLVVKDPGGRFLYGGGASWITVQHCRFENSEYPRAWESCRFKRAGDHITFRDNVIIKGNDSVAITGGSFHLIEGNTFEGASHTCLVLMGVQRSVVRGNRLTNPIQKLMEVFTTRSRDVGDAIRRSEYLVIEDNVFGPAPQIEVNGTNSGSGSAGIQYAGNRSILRRNVYLKCGMGMDFTWYHAGRDDPEALYCSHNRFYHNTVYDCGWPARYGSGPGIWISGGHEGIGDNLLVNNILYRNHAHPDAHFPPDTPHDVQLALADMDSFRLLGNMLMGREKGAVTVWDKAGKTGFTLAAFEAQFPQTARGNLEADPEFVDAEAGDFRLRPGSPCIDAGNPLTRTRSAGKGTVVEVDDALFFSDGFGLVEPDVIRVGGNRAQVVKVDFAHNRLELDRSISWEAGEPVTLDYQGKAPDLGAVECEPE
jgi:hypothetical protein